MVDSRSFDVEKLEKPSPDALIARFKNWLVDEAPHPLRGELLSFESPSAASGRSGDTYIICIAHSDKSRGQRQYVLRAELGSTGCPDANFDNMLTAHRILGKDDGLAVPGVVYNESTGDLLGGPFFIMEFCEGVAAPDSPPFSTAGWLFEATPEQRQSLCRSGIEFLVKLHQLDWRALGLETLLRRDSESSQTEQHLTSLIDIYDRALDGKRHEVGAATIDWLYANLPAVENLCMTWGDCRPGNGLWQEFRLSAALDWEMCGISEPGADIGLWLFSESAVTDALEIPRLEGMMMREEFLEEYEKRAGASVPNFDFFEIFSAFRTYVIVTDMMKMYEHHGQDFLGPSFDTSNSPYATTMQTLLSRQ
ncbi:MAG: phosphotransferase family protein [Halieaceae bacterium]|nr:phosphotransferase family protein [Halieaceae bacterium]